MLAEKLFEAHRYEDNVVLCLSPGAVLVGAEIAKKLHCVLSMLLVKDVALPGTQGATVGTLDQAGSFTFNSMFSAGELEEFKNEYHGHIEYEKMTKMHEINQLLGEFGIVDQQILSDHSIVIVSDGLKSGTSFDAAITYLKPIRTVKLIAATPFASIPAVDKLHILTDEIQLLDVKENYMGTDHYYEDNELPDNDGIRQIIDDIIHNWQ